VTADDVSSTIWFLVPGTYTVDVDGVTALLGEREDTLRRRVHRAREAVRQRLEGML
jgi:uncharacterized membrane protein